MFFAFFKDIKTNFKLFSHDTQIPFQRLPKANEITYIIRRNYIVLFY